MISFPFLCSEHEVLLNDSWHLKLDIHDSLKEHINDLIPIPIKLNVDGIELLLDSSGLLSHLLSLLLQLVLLRLARTVVLLLDHVDPLLCVRLGMLQVRFALFLCRSNDQSCLLLGLKEILHATVHS